MMLIDLDALPNPETGDAESGVLAAFLKLLCIHIWIHFDSPRSVLSPKWTERESIFLSKDAHFPVMRDPRSITRRLADNLASKGDRQIYPSVAG